MRSSRAISAERESNLGPRQRELATVIYARGGATALEIHAAIADAPSSVCAIRTLLNRMVRNGLLRSRRSGRHREMIYLPAVSDFDASLRAFDRIAKEYFHGSRHRAVEALDKLAACEAARAKPAPQLRAA